MNKWSKQFWIDLGERVGSTLIGALLTLLTMDNILEGPDWNTVLWPIVVVPTLFSLLKGLGSNLAHPESGASAVPGTPEIRPENGETDILYALGIALVVLTVALLVTTLLKVFVVGWVVLIVLAVIGFFLIFWRGGGVNL